MTNANKNSCLRCAIYGALLLASIPALGGIVLVILNINDHSLFEIICAVIITVVVTAISGAAGGAGFYVTQKWRQKGGLGNLFSWIFIVEAYVLTVIYTFGAIFVVFSLYNKIPGWEEYADIFFSPAFQLYLHVYIVLLAIFVAGLSTLNKFLRSRIF